MPPGFPAGVREGDDEATAEAEALAEWHAWWLPQWEAVAEGFCPTHRIPLEAVTCAPGWAGGHCPSCRAYWGDDLEKKAVRWTLDHEPRGQRRPVRPEWVLPG